MRCCEAAQHFEHLTNKMLAAAPVLASCCCVSVFSSHQLICGLIPRLTAQSLLAKDLKDGHTCGYDAPSSQESLHAGQSGLAIHSEGRACKTTVAVIVLTIRST